MRKEGKFASIRGLCGVQPKAELVAPVLTLVVQILRQGANHMPAETTFRQINFYRDKCRSLLQARLHRIDKVLSAHSVPRDKATYDRNASGVQSGLLPQSFEKKV